MTAAADNSEITLARIEALVRETRQAVLEGIEQALVRQVDPVLDRARQAVLLSTETILRQQTEPLLERTREMLMQTIDEIVKRHAAPLVGQMRQALRETLEEVVKSQMEPMLQRARQSVQESAQMAGQVADVMVNRLRTTVAQPAGEMLREQVPQYAQWAGRRTVDYVVAATLFCLAAIFLLVGGVEALQEMGLPRFATYILGGLAALGGGLVFLRVLSRVWPRPSPTDEGKSA